LAALGDADVHPHVARLAVATMPGSATPEEQLADAGIDATAIVRATKRMLDR
jgi:transketolase